MQHSRRARGFWAKRSCSRVSAGVAWANTRGNRPVNILCGFSHQDIAAIHELPLPAKVLAFVRRSPESRHTSTLAALP